MKIAAAVSGDRLSTSGNVAVRAFRYRNLPIGDTYASWSSARDVVDGSLAIGGAEGRLRAGGSRRLLARSESLRNARALALRSARDRQRSRPIALGRGVGISDRADYRNALRQRCASRALSASRAARRRVDRQWNARPADAGNGDRRRALERRTRRRRPRRPRDSRPLRDGRRLAGAASARLRSICRFTRPRTTFRVSSISSHA